jgi:adenosylhomocysteine nucleosidase
MLTTPEEKRDLGSRYSAAAVDMESAIVAELCSRERVPFGCLRAVSDDARTALSPRLASLLAGGRASPLRLLAHLVRSPRLAGELLRLARHTRRTADQLGETLGKLLRG